MPRRREPTLPRLLVAAALLAIATSVSIVAQVPATGHPGHEPVDTCADGRVVTRGPWTSIATPQFPDSAAARRIVAYGVDPSAPAHLIATNGTTVVASSDGGCEWTTTYQTPTVPSLGGGLPGGVTSGARFTVAHLAFPGPQAYLAITGTDGTGREVTRVVVSDDRGATWTDRSAGLPPVGGVRFLVAAPGRAATAYIAIDGAGILATDDGGTSWVTRWPTGPGRPMWTNMVVDPGVESELWAWTDATMVHSSDGGVTFTKSAGGSAANTAVQVVDVGRAPGAAASRIVAVYSSERAARSDDGGRTWRRIEVPVGIIALASDRRQPDRIVGVTEDRVYAHVPATGAWDEISPPSAERFAQPRGTAAARPMVFVRSENGLERTTLDQPIGAPDRNAKVAPLRLLPPQPARVEPAGRDVPVVPGTEVAVERLLTVPARRGALDVYFLVDTTRSMGPLLRGLEEGIGSITQSLADARIDARFGVGEVKDYPVRPWGEPGDIPYRRVLDLGAGLPELRAALASLTESGGGDLPESQLAGLYQAATGAGQLPLVGPGQQATFRADARRVIVLGTDAAFHRSDGDPSYPGPRFATTVDAVRRAGIAVVGIALDPDARPDLQQVGVSTGAVSTTDLDCDGDGKRDVLAGQPIVCSLKQDGTNLAAAVVAALAAVDDAGEITVAATGPGGVVRRVEPARSGVVNLRADQRLKFTTVYGCNPDQAGQRIPVSVSAAAKGESVLTVADTVVCAAAAAAVAAPPPPPPPPPAPAKAAPQPSPAPQAPSPPAPAPVQPVIQVQPQPQLQPQVQPQVQPGVASQEQERVQLAVAGLAPLEGEEGLDDVLAFSDHRARDETVPALPLAAAAMTGAAWWALRRSERRNAWAPARVHDRRSR